MTVYAITDTKKGEQGLRLLIFKLGPEQPKQPERPEQFLVTPGRRIGGCPTGPPVGRFTSTSTPALWPCAVLWPCTFCSDRHRWCHYQDLTLDELANVNGISAYPLVVCTDAKRALCWANSGINRPIRTNDIIKSIISNHQMTYNNTRTKSYLKLNTPRNLST